MIKSSGVPICSLSSTPAVRLTPLPHLHAHLTPCAMIVTGANATHHLPDEVRANHRNPGFVTHVCESLLEQTHLMATGLPDNSPVVHQWQRRLLRRATKHHHGLCNSNTCTLWRLHLVVRFTRLEHFLFWIAQHRLSWRRWSLTSMHLASRSFTQKHRLPQCRDDCAKGF